MKRNKYINTFDTTAEYENYIESAAAEFPNVALTKDNDKVNYMSTSPNNHVWYGEVVDSSQSLPTIYINDTVNTPTLDSLTNMFYLDSWTSNTPTSIYFSDKSNMKSIKKFKGLDTSSITSMSGMFADCSSLTSVDLSSLDTSPVTDMNNMFNNCASLTSLDLSNFNTSSVTDMNNMFNHCESLTSLDLSSFNTSKVTDMSVMFSYCTSLTSVYLSNFNTSSVTDMSNMFAVCSSLTTLDLSNFNTSSVAYMGYMFFYCSSLTTLNLSNFNTHPDTNIDGMFTGCTSLTDVYITVEATLMKLTNNLSSQGDNYIPSNNGNCTIHYNGTDYKWQNDTWTPQS